jgi:glyoxylase-like metal-dependent hydrolase (beta-lactamase superfamily II)
MEIAQGIHTIPTGIDRLLGSFAPQVYLVIGREAALIDSGYGDDESVRSRLDYVNNLADLRLAYIVITHAHPDHISGAMLLRQQTGAKIVLHRAEQTDIVVDRFVEDGDIISLSGIDLEVVHTPGHNPGHICLYIRKQRIMFSGDHVLSKSTTAIQPPKGDMTQYIDSLKKLLDYDIDLIFPAHGPVLREPRSRLQDLIEHRIEREEQVIAGLRQGKSTVKELVAEIYPQLTGFLYEVAKGQVYAHLIKLEREGRASSQGDGENARYEIALQRREYA